MGCKWSAVNGEGSGRVGGGLPGSFFAAVECKAWPAARGLRLLWGEGSV